MIESFDPKYANTYMDFGHANRILEINSIKISILEVTINVSFA